MLTAHYGETPTTKRKQSGVFFFIMIQDALHAH